MTHNRSSCIDEVFFALCKSVNTPFSLGAWLRYKYDHKLYLDLDINPRNYEDAHTFSGDYLVKSFLSKYKGLKTGYNLEEIALSSFTSSEESCLLTNQRFLKCRNSVYPDGLSSVLYRAQRKIASLLGPFSLFKLDASYGWGPGATADISRRCSFVDTKMCQTPISVSRSALGLFRSVLTDDLHWSSAILNIPVDSVMGPFSWLPSVFNVVDYCVIDTVPKSSKTHRVIAKEPTANGFLQKGVGGFIRKRLLSVGIDLHDQESNKLAAKAAVHEGLATLDLRAASDTLAMELVYELLPVDWALFLDDIRCRYAKMPDGSTIKLQKCSSMGNGFTFELETLIFWAVSSAVSEEQSPGGSVLVYGDDIIVDKQCATRLIEVLRFCGFETNVSKSFIDGLFYESCGGHYFNGVDVTPVYQKEVLSDDIEVIRLGNRLMRCAHRFGHYSSLDKRLHNAWNRAHRSAGPSAIFQLPLGSEGDDGWLTLADDFHPVPQDINLGLRCRVAAPPPSVRLPANERALLALSLRNGVVTESPYGGDLSYNPTISRRPIRKSGRWIMPTWEFGLSW